MQCKKYIIVLKYNVSCWSNTFQGLNHYFSKRHDEFFFLHKLDFYKDIRLISLNTRKNISKYFTHIYNSLWCWIITCFPYPISGSNITKWHCISNFCYDCLKMNVPDLESSEQLHSLFPASLHKFKFHIFQNVSKFSIRGLRSFR